MPTYPKPPLRTRADLQQWVDAGREEQNGHGYDKLVYWLTTPDEFGKMPNDSEIGRAMNKDRRTIAGWREVYEADR